MDDQVVLTKEDLETISKKSKEFDFKKLVNEKLPMTKAKLDELKKAKSAPRKDTYRSRCWSCGKFIKQGTGDYCPEHSQEFPDCKCFLSVLGGCNVCLPNAPYSCKRARKEKLCDINRSCADCGLGEKLDSTGRVVCVNGYLILNGDME